jgi:tetratricopeptide (TPR) repeat protein
MTDEPHAGKANQASDPQFRQALNESARLLSANRPGEAARILETLRKEHPHDPDIAINLGGALILQRKWNRAVTVLESAAKTHPDNAMLWSNLAAAYLGRLETAGPKQQEKAISAYERAIQLDPKAPNVHYHLGLIHKERGSLERAYAHFQRASEVNPADRDARFWIDRLGEMLADDVRQRNQDRQDEEGNAA